MPPCPVGDFGGRPAYGVTIYKSVPLLCLGSLAERTSRPDGTFTLSLDTELAWGRFDTEPVEERAEQFRATPGVVTDLCTLCDRYDVPATWALVAHLLVDCRDTARHGHPDQTPPAYDWVDDWFRAAPCTRGLNDAIWYWPDVVSTLQSATVSHDIGLHGYTHVILGADGCSRAAASDELDRAVDVLRAASVDPVSFVYPRNRVGHRDVLADRGFDIVRTPDAEWYEQRSLPGWLRKPLRFATEATRRTPPVVTPTMRDGLVEIPGSQLYRPLHGGWQYTPDGSQVDRALAGLDRAAETGKIFHLWFHPSNLARDPGPLLDGLERVFEHAAALQDAGELAIRPMDEVATAFRNGRWSGVER